VWCFNTFLSLVDIYTPKLFFAVPVSKRVFLSKPRISSSILMAFFLNFYCRLHPAQLWNSVFQFSWKKNNRPTHRFQQRVRSTISHTSETAQMLFTTISWYRAIWLPLQIHAVYLAYTPFPGKSPQYSTHRPNFIKYWPIFEILSHGTGRSFDVIRRFIYLFHFCCFY